MITSLLQLTCACYNLLFSTACTAGDFNTTITFLTGKTLETNDLDPLLSPNESEVIFVNTSNDGISQQNILKVELADLSERTTFIQDAKMPDWQ